MTSYRTKTLQYDYQHPLKTGGRPPAPAYNLFTVESESIGMDNVHIVHKLIFN